MIEAPSTAIDLLGGVRAVSESIERPLTTVASWVSRESIPIEAWPALIKLAARLGVAGVSYETLALAHAGRRQSAKRKGGRAADAETAIGGE